MKRRTVLINGILVSIPFAWHKPLTESVILPAHAQTSEDPPNKDEPPRDEPPKEDPPKDDPPEECENVTLYRIKSASSSSWESDPGVGAQDCLDQGNNTDGATLAAIQGDDRFQTVTLTGQDCEIVAAAFKAGPGCRPGEIAADGLSATFTAGQHDISHVELVIECCE